MHDINELVLNIREWGYNKGILKSSYTSDEWDKLTLKQWEKTREEVNELYDGIIKNSKLEVSDALGDTIVTLVMQAELWGIDVSESLNDVYNIISKRKGKMVDGQFVKDESN